MLRLQFVILAGALGHCGCTAESTRVALETQQRVDVVQQTVFDNQHDGLRILLFRDLLRRLQSTGVELTVAQIETLNKFWNERDLVEFWALQNERALGLRRVGVDAKLYSDQSVLDLLWKALSAKVQRGEEALAAMAGAALPSPVDTSTGADAPPTIDAPAPANGGAASGESAALE